MKSYIHYIVLILGCIPLWMNAQVFPVQANPQVIPPYSLKLSEYGTSSSEKLVLNLLLTDITESNRQVQLKFFLENNSGISIRSNDLVIGANPIFLDGGVPLRLSNIDLQPYFSLQNLAGITPQQYSTALPEGLYQFCFEVYDAISGQQISRKSCVPVYLVLNDPPFLNLPLRGEQVLIKEPQNIIFQWTPRHLNATNVSYEFTLTELWDNQMDPQAAFLAGRPLYQTNTFATTLLYGPAETPLLPDKKYGWRVRAMVSDGISETSVFKNDGYSEIHYFTYTGSCAEPETILSEAKNHTTEKIYWQGVDHITYDVQYRKMNVKTGLWFNASTTNTSTTIYNLEPGTTYEFRVGGQCVENGPYTYSQIYQFTTTLPGDNETTFNCGIPPEIVITNQEPLTQLIVNETFTAGDFPVTIKDIVQGNRRYVLTENEENEDEKPEEIEEPTGGDGIFSGWGYIVVPYLNDIKIKVSFQGIKINTDYQLIEGVVETDYDQNWGGLSSVDEVLDLFEGDNDLRNINLNYDITIENISIADNGEIVIRHPVSNVPNNYPGGDDVIIMDTNVDGSRDIFHVDADGNIREGGQLAPGGAINPQSTEGVDSNGEVIALTAKGIKVDFVNASDYTYGFDWIPEGQEKQLGAYYRQIKDVAGQPYAIINKAVGNGNKDVIKAKVTITDANLSISDLVIKTVHGENVPYQIVDKNNGVISLELNGYYSFEHVNIYATILSDKSGSDKQTIAGVFSQWHLSDKQVNLTVIPVDNPNLPDAAQLEAGINKIFQQASARFNVTVASPINAGMATVGVGDSGLTSNYTEDQKKIINQFRQIRKPDPKSYYVFVLGKNVRPSRSVAGFMPIQRQFGFVFTSNLADTEEGKTSLEGTLAHELGHGVFGLEHPFSQYKTTRGGTDWLLDYGNGTKFSHLDWTQMHNPTFKLYKFLFMGDLDGALTVSALAPNGMIINYTGNGAIVFTDEIPEYSNGTVFAILEDGKIYEWHEEPTTSHLRSHYFIHGNEKLDNVEIGRLSDNIPLQLYWNKGSCDKNEIYTTSVDAIRNYLISANSTLPARLTLDLNSTQYEGIDLSGKAGCSDNALCGNIAMADFKPELEELIRISNEIAASRNTITVGDLAKKVNGINICGLKTLDFQVVKIMLPFLMSQTTFDSNLVSEEAIVKLLLCIPANQYTDFTLNLISIWNEIDLDNVIGKMTNNLFQGFSESGQNYFLETFTQIVTGSENDELKWKVFNSIIRSKIDSLQGYPLLAMNQIMVSIEDQTDVNRLNAPAVIEIFIKMLEDPNIKEMHAKGKYLTDYKIIFDIASIKNEKDVFFRSFTLSDVITLTRNPNHYASNLPNKIGGDKMDLPISFSRYSWLIPSVEYLVNEPAIKGGEYLYDEYYLDANSVWFRYLKENNLNTNSFTVNPENFLNVFYEQLSNYLVIGNESNSEFWERIGTVDCSNILDVIFHINQNENSRLLQNVNRDTRLNFVRLYFTCDEIPEFGNDRSQALGRIDDSLMKVLISIDKSNQSILYLIEDIGLEKIYNHLGTVEFNRFSTWIGIQILKTGTGEKVKIPNEMMSPQDIPFMDASKLYQLEANIFQFRNLSGNIDGNQIKIGDEKLDYNQLVLVHVSGSFNFLGQRYKQGDVLLVPIIQAFAMSESNQSTVTTNSILLTIDVASVAIPILSGATKVFRLSGHYAAKAFMASDLAASSASAVVTALNEDAIDPDLRFKIQMASLLASVPGLVSNIPNNFPIDDFRVNIDLELNNLSSSNRISASSRNMLQSLYKVGQNVDQVDIKFSRSFVNSLDGFYDNIVTYARNNNITISNFKQLQQKRYDQMTPSEMASINGIRNSIPRLTNNTLLQKVVPLSQIEKYLDRSYYQVGGFITTAKDAKHLTTFEDVYYGMRLDYEVNGVRPFDLSDGGFGVIRYKTNRPNADIPILSERFNGDLPFTGNGFSGGNNGRLGVPEWHTGYVTPSYGELWEVAADGTETLRAVFNTSINRFIRVSQ